MWTEEIEVHRLRFGDWVPSAIKSITSDPFSTRVAIGRIDGDIEICESSFKWYTQVRVPGRVDFELQALAWSIHSEEKCRLFGISLRGFIFEVDMKTLTLKNVSDSYGGAPWCLSLSPRAPKMVIGCEDGCAKIFEYAGGTISYSKSFPTTGSRVLSVAYHPVQSRIFLGCADGTIRCVDEDTGRGIFRMSGDISRGISTFILSIAVMRDSTVVSGDSRGHLQIWDGETGVLMVSIRQHAAEILTLAVSPDENFIFASGVDSRIICIQRLPQGTSGQSFAAADSNWVYSTSHRPHSHDVLTLAICHPKSHPTTGPLLMSGGLDCKLCTYSVEDFARVRPSWILPVPPKGLACASGDFSLIAMKHRNSVDVWQVSLAPISDLPHPVSEEDAEISTSKRRKSKKTTETDEVSNVVKAADVGTTPTDAEMDKRCVLALRLNFRDDYHIHCCALSPDGRLIALSSQSGLRIWTLVAAPGTGGLTALKIQLPRMLSNTLCHALEFSFDSRRLAVHTAKGKIVLLDVASDSLGLSLAEQEDMAELVDGHEEKKVTSIVTPIWHTLDHKIYVHEHVQSKGDGAVATSAGKAAAAGEPGDDEAVEMSTEADIGHGICGLEYVVSAFSFSSDGCYMAAADSHRGVYVYDLDRLRLHWKLPELPSVLTSISFHPDSPTSLVCVLANNTFLIFDVEVMAMSPWSIAHTDKIPAAVRGGSCPLEGLVFRSMTPGKEAMFLYGQGSIVYVDVNKAIPQVPKLISPIAALAQAGLPQTKVGGGGRAKASAKRRKCTESSRDSNFAVIEVYRSIILAGCHRGKQLVVLENPWMRIRDKLPDTLRRKRYGT